MICFSVMSLVKSETLYSEVLFHLTPFIQTLFTLFLLNTLSVWTHCPQFEHNWIDWLLYTIYSVQIKWDAKSERDRQKNVRSPQKENEMNTCREQENICCITSFTAVSFLISYYVSSECWKTALLVTSICGDLDACP